MVTAHVRHQAEDPSYTCTQDFRNPLSSFRAFRNFRPFWSRPAPLPRKGLSCRSRRSPDSIVRAAYAGTVLSMLLLVDRSHALVHSMPISRTSRSARTPGPHRSHPSQAPHSNNVPNQSIKLITRRASFAHCTLSSNVSKYLSPKRP